MCSSQPLSEAYDPIHPPDAITTHLPREKQWAPICTGHLARCSPCARSLGPIDPKTVVRVEKVLTEEEKKRQALMAARPPLDEIVNLHDFEVSLGKEIRPPTSDGDHIRPFPKSFSLPKHGHTTLLHRTTRSPSGRIVQPIRGKLISPHGRDNS